VADLKIGVLPSGPNASAVTSWCPGETESLFLKVSFSPWSIVYVESL